VHQLSVTLVNLKPFNYLVKTAENCLIFGIEMNSINTYFKFNSSKWFLTLTLFFGLFACLGNSVSYQQHVKTVQTELVFSADKKTETKTSVQKKIPGFDFKDTDLLSLSILYNDAVKVKLYCNFLLVSSFEKPSRFFQTKIISQSSDEDPIILV